METPSPTDNDQKLVADAETILADWPKRMAMIPAEKPLSAAWLPKVSPNTGKGDTWWNWSPDSPDRLVDSSCDQALPDAFPYRNHAAFCCYTETLKEHEDFTTLVEASRVTADARYALAFVEMLARYSTIYPTYPVTFEKDAPAGVFRTYGPEAQGTHYTDRVGSAWSDTWDLQRWLWAYRLVLECVDVPTEKDHAVRELAREVIEFESLPNFLYVNDKFHNSLTDYYDAFALVGAIWGPEIVVRDTVGGTTYSGGDLLQLAVNGPKGIRMFAANAFDRNGVYWERSASYTGYIFGYLEKTLSLLKGLSDRPDYVPGEAVRPFYRPIRDFDPAEQLPHLWRGVLAQTRLCLTDGLYPPTNDTNYLNGPQAEWLETWAELLNSEAIRRAARGVRSRQGDEVSGESDPFPPEGSTLMPACGATTLRGPSNRLSAHLDWHRMQDYHSHLDPLNLVIAADGGLALSDLGYHLGHPLRHIISERTAAHNTVTVDQSDCRHHQRGELHHYLDDGEVQLADASVPDAYAQCSLYRRTVVLVGDRYVLDVFRVEGGPSHDYALLGRSDQSECSLELAESKGTLAAPDEEYAGFDDLSQELANPAEPYEVMHHPRVAPGTECFTVDWPLRDNPGVTTRVHHLSGKSAQVIFAKAPHKDRRADSEVRTDEAMIVRREGEPPLSSTFVSVVEAFSAQTPPLSAVRRVELDSPDPWAIAIEVDHESGTDVFIHSPSDGPHRLVGRAITLTGRFVALRYRGDGQAPEVMALIGKMAGGAGEASASPQAGARVRDVDCEKGIITLDRPLVGGGDLAGRFVVVRGSTGRPEHWRVASMENDGTTLRLDLAHSRMVIAQGTIEAIENSRIIVTGVNFCDEILPGTPIRIGPVGDMSAPRVYLETAQQTGLPLRIGGTTTNMTPRLYYLGLRRYSELSEDDVGKSFWTSGIEVGDCVVVPAGQ